jgi:hypothetical protein
MSTPEPQAPPVPPPAAPAPPKPPAAIPPPVEPAPEPKPPPTTRVELEPMRPAPGETREDFTVRFAAAVRAAAKGEEPSDVGAAIKTTGAARDPSNGEQPQDRGPTADPEPKSAKTDMPGKFSEYAGNKPATPYT